MLSQKPSKNFDWQARRFYLEIADEDYLGARTLCLMGIFLPAGVLAQQAVEKYIKLRLIELTDKTNRGHDLVALFGSLRKQNRKSRTKNAAYYKNVLTQLTNSFNWKYFDEDGLLGAIQKKHRMKPVVTGLGSGLLDKFDELCMEIRNGILSDSGGTPVNKAINSNKPWSRGNYDNFGWAFYTRNNYAQLFKANTTRRNRF